MRTILKVILIALLFLIFLPVAGIGGLIFYVNSSNAIFLQHPTYLPSQIYVTSTDSSSPGDLNPIIQGMTYFYQCKNYKETGVGFVINQSRLHGNADVFSNPSRSQTSTDGYFPVPGKPQPPDNFMRPEGYAINNPNFIFLKPEDFTLIDIKQITQNNKTFLFKKFTTKKIPLSIFELTYKNNNIGLFIKTDSGCMPDNIAETEMVKLAESMH